MSHKLQGAEVYCYINWITGKPVNRVTNIIGKLANRGIGELTNWSIGKSGNW